VLKKGMGKIKPYLIFALTDETYSLVCSGDTSLYVFSSVCILKKAHQTVSYLFSIANFLGVMPFSFLNTAAK